MAQEQRPAWMVDVNSFDEACKKAIEHGPNPEPMAYYLRLCLRFGPPDAAAQEWVEGQLSAALMRLLKGVEAFEVAQQSWQKFRSPRSLAFLVDAARHAGYLDYAPDAMREPDRCSDQLPDLKGFIQQLREELSVRIFLCDYIFPASVLAGKDTVVLTTPLSDSPRQQSLSRS